MPIQVPTLNPDLLKGAAPSGFSNLVPHFLKGMEVAQTQQKLDQDAYLHNLAVKEKLQNLANMSRTADRQEAYRDAVSKLDTDDPDYRTKLFNLQTRFSDVVDAQIGLLPDPVTQDFPEIIELAKFLYPDDETKQRSWIEKQKQTPENVEELTTVQRNIQFAYPDDKEAQIKAMQEYLAGKEQSPTAAVINARALCGDDEACFEDAMRQQIFSPEKTQTLTTAQKNAKALYPDTMDNFEELRREYIKKVTLKEDGTINFSPTIDLGLKKGEEELYKLYVKNEERIQEQARAAEQTFLNTTQMLNILEKGDLRTGALAGLATRLRKIGIAMFPGLAEEWGTDIGLTEAFEAFGNRAALSLRKEMPGPLSERDVRFLQASAPGLPQTQEGNMVLLSLMIRGALRTRAYARFANQYATENNFVDRGFHAWLEEQEGWQQFKGFTDGYQEDSNINKMLTTINHDDDNGVEKILKLPPYTVYYIKEEDGVTKTIHMTKPWDTVETLSGQEAVEEPSVILEDTTDDEPIMRGLPPKTDDEPDPTQEDPNILVPPVYAGDEATPGSTYDPNLGSESPIVDDPNIKLIENLPMESVIKIMEDRGMDVLAELNYLKSYTKDPARLQELTDAIMLYEAGMYK